MTTSLQSLDYVQSVLLFRWTIFNYRVDPNDFPNEQVLRFSDSTRDETYLENGAEVVYYGLGPLVSFGGSKNSIRATGAGVVIGIAGVPDTDIKTILASDIKGSRMVVRRLFEYPGTNNTISDLDYTGPNSGGGIIGRFSGYVNTYSISDDIDHSNDIKTVEVTLDCVNIHNIISKLTKGIRTNPVDLRYLRPTDPSFDNVPALYNSDWYFGGSK